MKPTILSRLDFYSIKESDVYTEQFVERLIDMIKVNFNEKYEHYGRNIIDEYARHMLLKRYYKNYLLEIKEGIYVKWEDFAEVVEFNKDGITHFFIDGLYDINLTNEYGEYLDKKLQGHMLIGF